jgi:RNA polymerase sigma factor (sigma-70 family)
MVITSLADVFVTLAQGQRVGELRRSLSRIIGFHPMLWSFRQFQKSRNLPNCGLVFPLSFPGPEAKSKSDSDMKKDLQPEELFAQAEPLFNNAVRFAFLKYQHRPSTEDVGRLRQRLSMHLLEDNYRRLRTYNQQAKLETWLQTVVNREVSHFLQQGSRQVSFDDVPTEIITQLAMQEVLLLRKEQEQLLAEALTKLTEHERKLIELTHQELAAGEIARELGIRVTSVYSQRSALYRKLSQLVEERQK